jgi:hypothetical protein
VLAVGIVVEVGAVLAAGIVVEANPSTGRERDEGGGGTLMFGSVAGTGW